MGVCKAGRTGFPIPRCECSVFHGWTRTLETDPQDLTRSMLRGSRPAGRLPCVHACRLRNSFKRCRGNSTGELIPRARGDERPAVVYTSVQSL